MSGGTLAFVKVPESSSLSLGSFKLDPAIPLPLLLEEGAEAAGPSALTRERLLGGVLAFLSRGVSSGAEDPRSGYYRDFAKAAAPELPAQLSAVGTEKARNGSFAEAEDVFIALEGLEPGSDAPVVNRGLVSRERAAAARRAGREEEAEGFEAAAKRHFERAVALDGASPVAFFHAGSFFEEMQDFERAASLFDAAISLGLEGPMAEEASRLSRGIKSRGLMDELFKEAYDFVRMGKEEEGLERLELFMEGHPDLWNAWFLRGWALRRLKRWAQGADAFARALELVEDESDSVDVLNELSICLSETGRDGDAKKALERALFVEPENVKLISNLGALALKRGDEAEARAFFAAALEIDPGDAVAARCLRDLEDGA
jgi:tetratricopeptide (TPR) repeat protein